MQEDQQKQSDATDSLESSLEVSPAAVPENQVNPPNQTQTAEQTLAQQQHKKLLSKLSNKWSIYIPFFIILLLGIGVATLLLYRNENKQQPTIAEQNLSPSQLRNLGSGNSILGNSNQLLTVQSNSIFDKQVLIRGQLQVAGPLQISELQINKNLSIAGNGSIQGTLSVQNDLSVAGNGSFSGSLSAAQLTTGSLNLNGNLSLTHHILTSGPIPGSSTGAATGTGGTTSVSGSDISGTVTINTGGSPAAGCYITVNFSSAYTSTPHVLLTPVGASSATLQYYVNRSAASFNVCSASTPQAGQTYVFDYMITG